MDDVTCEVEKSQRIWYNPFMTRRELNTIFEFYHHISPIILNLVAKNFRKSQQITNKSSKKETINFVTETDLEVEKIIAKAMQRKFPNDLILSEETFSKTKLDSSKRLWVIDPICGTANFAKEIKFFCTNIALAQNGKVVAACVIDHSQNEYISSIGGNKIFIGKKLVKTNRKTSGIEVEVDLSGVTDSSKEIKQKHARFVSRFLMETDYTALTHASSLGYAYLSLGRIDAYVNPDIHLWDMAAANFLTVQAGGIVTEISGAPWTLESKSVLAARDKNLHRALLGLLSNS